MLRMINTRAWGPLIYWNLPLLTILPHITRGATRYPFPRDLWWGMGAGWNTSFSGSLGPRDTTLDRCSPFWMVYMSRTDPLLFLYSLLLILSLSSSLDHALFITLCHSFTYRCRPPLGICPLFFISLLLLIAPAHKFCSCALALPTGGAGHSCC